jgi:hypothetical protein
MSLLGLVIFYCPVSRENFTCFSQVVLGFMAPVLSVLLKANYVLESPGLLKNIDS